MTAIFIIALMGDNCILTCLVALGTFRALTFKAQVSCKVSHLLWQRGARHCLGNAVLKLAKSRASLA